jgi:hypothetical protein
VEGNDAVKEQQEKVLVILEAYAIVDPWTMVIHF